MHYKNDISFNQACAISKRARADKKVVVLAHGFFDILHVGHVDFLSKAKKLGDLLFVAIDNDYNCRHFKGAGRPINKQKYRAVIVSGLRDVDYVFNVPMSVRVSKGRNFFRDGVYKRINPNIVVTCSAASNFSEGIRDTAQELNLKFVNIPIKYKGFSSTNILDKLNDENRIST